MKLAIWGSSEKVCEEEWRDAAEWYAAHLLPKKMADQVSVCLELSARLRGMLGAIVCTGEKRRPRQFLIQIEAGMNGRRRQLYAFGHEMVHLKQLVLREMVLDGPTVTWRAKRPVPQAWRDEPWEEEAYGRERELYRLFNERPDRPVYKP